MKLEAFFFMAVATIGYGLHMLVLGRQMSTAQRLERAVQWWFGGAGAWLLFGASGHLFIPDEVAKSIGWAPGSPFQREVGFSDLAWGVLGLMSIKVRGTLREAFVIGAGIFLLGAAGGHIYEMVAHDNFARNNSGLLLSVDIGMPIVSAILLWRLRLAERRSPRVASARSGDPTTGLDIYVAER